MNDITGREIKIGDIIITVHSTTRYRRLNIAVVLDKYRGMARGRNRDILKIWGTQELDGNLSLNMISGRTYPEIVAIITEPTEEMRRVFSAKKIRDLVYKGKLLEEIRDDKSIDKV